MRSWLDTLVRAQLAKLPKPPKEFYPSVLFNFDQIGRAVLIVEEATEQIKAEAMAQSKAAIAAAALDPFHNFIDKPVFAPMAAAFWETEITFPTILRRSLLIATYSHVEHVLRRWCDGLHSAWSLKRDYRSFAKRPRRRKPPTPALYLLYLRDEAGIDIGDFEQWSEWQLLDAYRLARNCLAHNGGIVQDDEERARIQALPQVQVDTSGLLSSLPIVHLLPGACQGAVTTAKEFLERLHEAYGRHPRVVATRFDPEP